MPVHRLDTFLINLPKGEYKTEIYNNGFLAGTGSVLRNKLKGGILVYL